MRPTSLKATGPDQAFTLRFADPAWIALTENQLLHNSWTKPRGPVTFYSYNPSNELCWYVTQSSATAPADMTCLAS